MKQSKRIKSVKYGCLTLSLVFIILYSFGLFEQSPNAVIQQIKVSRFVLGHWPENWSDVERSIVQFPSEPDASLGKYENVFISPKSSSECTVVLWGRNALWFYKKTELTLWWNEEDELRFSNKEKVKKDQAESLKRYEEEKARRDQGDRPR